METSPRLDPGWPWWMVAFVVLVWLAVVAGAVGLLVRSRRARRRRRAASSRAAAQPGAGLSRIELPGAPDGDDA